MACDVSSFDAFLHLQKDPGWPASWCEVSIVTGPWLGPAEDDVGLNLDGG